MRLASLPWPGPDSSPTTPRRQAMAISSASHVARTSGPVPAEKPMSVATTRTARMRHNQLPNVRSSQANGGRDHVATPHHSTLL